MTGKAEAGKVIIEMRPVGSVVRVAAIDVASHPKPDSMNVAPYLGSVNTTV